MAMCADKEVKHWAFMGTLAAYALVLSYIETALVLPVPGMKLGLANAVILVALLGIDLRSAFFIGLIKVFGAALFFGSPLAVLFSLAGTLVSILVMGLLGKVLQLDAVIVASFGAIAHSAAQLFVAGLLFHTFYVWAYAPFIFVFSCFSGIVTGKLASLLLPFVLRGLDQPVTAGRLVVTLPLDSPRLSVTHGRSPLFVLACSAFLLVLVLVTVVSTSPVFLLVLLAGFGLLAFAEGIRIGDVTRAFRPLLVLALFTLLSQTLFAQEGQIVFAFGFVEIRDAALLEAALTLLRMSCIVLASLDYSRIVAPADLLEIFTCKREGGSRLEMLVLSLEAAIYVLPSLVDGFKQGVSRSASASKDETEEGRSRLRRRIAAVVASFAGYFEGSFEQTTLIVAEYLAVKRGSDSEA